MVCKEIYEKLFDYLEGAVTEDEKKLIQQHIEKCTSCYKEYQELKETIQLVQNLPKLKAPDDFAENLILKINERQYQKQRRFMFWLGRIAFAEVIALVLVILFNQPYKKQTVPQFGGNNQISIQEGTKQKEIEKQQMVVKQGKIKEKPETEYVSKEKKVQPELVIQLAYRMPDDVKLLDKKFTPEEKTEGRTDQIIPEPMSTRPLIMGTKESEKKPEKAITSYLAEKTGVEKDLTSYVLSLNGKIVSDQLLTDTDINRIVVVEIPAHTYKDFVELLKERFQVKNLPEFNKDADLSETIIKIRLEIFR